MHGLNEDRDECNLYAIEAKRNPKVQQLTKGTLAMVKGDYKIIHYTGYGHGTKGITELFNITQDPEEMVDLADKRPRLKKELLEELLSKLNEADQSFMDN